MARQRTRYPLLWTLAMAALLHVAATDDDFSWSDLFGGGWTGYGERQDNARENAQQSQYPPNYASNIGSRTSYVQGNNPGYNHGYPAYNPYSPNSAKPWHGLTNYRTDDDDSSEEQGRRVNVPLTLGQGHDGKPFDSLEAAKKGVKFFGLEHSVSGTSEESDSAGLVRHLVLSDGSDSSEEGKDDGPIMNGMWSQVGGDPSKTEDGGGPFLHPVWEDAVQDSSQDKDTGGVISLVPGVGFSSKSADSKGLDLEGSKSNEIWDGGKVKSLSPQPPVSRDTPKSSSSLTPSTNCQAAMDIAVLVDLSDSLSGADLQEIEMALSDMVDDFDLNIADTRLALLTYASVMLSRTSLSNNSAMLKSHIKGLKQGPGVPNTGLALQEMLDLMTSQGRHGIPKACIVITDERSSSTRESARLAAMARLAGIQMLAVAIGQDTDLLELQEIADDPIHLLTAMTVAHLFNILHRTPYTLCPEITTTGSGYTETPTADTTVYAITSSTPSSNTVKARTTIVPTFTPSTTTPPKTTAPTATTPTATIPTTTTPTATTSKTTTPTTTTPTTTTPTTTSPTTTPTTTSPATTAPTTTILKRTIPQSTFPVTAPPTSAPSTTTPMATSTTKPSQTTTQPSTRMETSTAATAPRTPSPTTMSTRTTTTAKLTTSARTVNPVTTRVATTAVRTTPQVTTLPTTTSTQTPQPTSTRPPATSTPRPNLPDICDNCTMVNGVGYKAHWTSCDMFVQCLFAPDGSVTVHLMQCPHGTHWDQAALTCNHPSLAHCTHDVCRQQGFRQYPATNNCRGYWECAGNRSEGKCCQAGYAYSTSGGCIPNSNCQSECGIAPTVPAVCDKRPVADKPFLFEQYVPGAGWRVMVCAPGTAFNHTSCACTDLSRVIKPPDVCRPELYIPFTGGTIQDESGNNNFIQNDGVKVISGAGYFDGNSTLRIPRFSNANYGDFILIRLRYKQDPGASGSGQGQALVANGDCLTPSSMYMAAGEQGVIVGLQATTGQRVNITLPDTTAGWKEAMLQVDRQTLTGNVNTYTMQTLFTGSLEQSQCALQFGRGTNFDHFKGFMDDIFVYLCRPTTL